MSAVETRKLDDLGRIYIPEQLRNAINVACGDPLDIELQNNKLVLSAHRVNTSIVTTLQFVADAVCSALMLPAAVCNSEIIAVSGLRTSYVGKSVATLGDLMSDKIYDCMEDEEVTVAPIESDPLLLARFICPVVKNSEIVYSIIVFKPKNFIPECEEFDTSIAKKILFAFSHYISNMLGDEEC